MKLRPDCVSIFLLPPSIKVLEQRLKKRGTDNDEDIKSRLALAEFEISYSDVYKYNVVNDDLKIAVDKINEILEIELEAHNRVSNSI